MIAAYQRISRADGDLGKDGKDKSNSIALLKYYAELCRLRFKPEWAIWTNLCRKVYICQLDMQSVLW